MKQAKNGYVKYIIAFLLLISIYIIGIYLFSSIDNKYNSEKYIYEIK